MQASQMMITVLVQKALLKECNCLQDEIKVLNEVLPLGLTVIQVAPHTLV